MSWGSDFKLDDLGDIVISYDGDIEIESTTRLIAQDLREEASIRLGSILWDKKAGSNFYKMINGNSFTDEDILSELERLAFNDPRVDATSVEALKTGEGKYRLNFSPLGGSISGLDLDIKDLYTGGVYE